MTKKAKVWIGVGLGCAAMLVVCVVGVVLAVAYGRKARVEAEARDLKHMERVTAEELLKEYRDNEVAADGRYKGYLAEITGTVDRVGRGVVGGEYVTLRDRSGLWAVQCIAADDETFASLRPGEDVTVRGRVQGKLGNVLVHDCVLR